jgi:hypothetical protein
MTSYTLQVQPRASYTIEYSNQRGPQGATGTTGPAGTGLTAIASGTILGNGLGDTALPQALNALGIRTILGLATFDSPTFVGLTLTGLQQFTGTSTVGLRLKSLTTAEYNALTAANGDLYRDSTTDRIDARLARGTVELIDSAGGQTITGTLQATALTESATAATGTGGLVRATSPTLVTPALGTPSSGVVTNLTGTASININGTVGATTPTTVVCTTLAASGSITASLNGAASTPVTTLTGTWFSGGTATTTKPQLLIEPTGTTSTNWSTSGTGLGINAASGFGGDFINAQVASVNTFRVSSSGVVSASFFRDFSQQANYFGSGINARNTWLVAYSNDGSDFGTKDLSFSRNAAGVLQIGNGTANASGSLLLTNLTASGTVRLGTYTVGTLPSASSNTRALAFVTDSSVGTFGSIVASGGSLGVTVYSNGTNWLVSGGSVVPQKAITSGTAAPSGGTDGDIYLQYT